MEGPTIKGHGFFVRGGSSRDASGGLTDCVNTIGPCVFAGGAAVMRRIIRAAVLKDEKREVLLLLFFTITIKKARRKPSLVR